MDPITHSLAGTVFFNLGFKRKFTLLVIIISSLAPDFDYITRLWGADVFLRYHRGITHGVFALIVVPVIIGLLFGYRKGFFYYTIISFFAYAIHLFLDLTNQYGTRILSPFDWEQYSLDLIFIIDPYVTLGFLFSLILLKLMKRKATVIAFITFILLFCYTGARYYLHGETEKFLREKVDAKIYKLCPLPNDFLRWWFIVKSGDKIQVGFADLFTQRICIQETYIRDESNPFIENSKNTRVVKNFLYFARFPYAEVKKDSEKITVIWRELSFSFRAGENFVAKVIYDMDGNELGSFFKF
ncbi:MAG: metal-dependent hydrolase [Nitrospirae bacterium]|nr:metal-dependent hydrolase [Nitrospirota bacterium]